MPSRTIYFNTINEIEQKIGSSFIDRDAIAKKLQEAWKNDETPAKGEFLKVYNSFFSEVLKARSDSELSRAFYNRSEKLADFKNSLLETDKALKVCAMDLIPELRENESVVKSMTFGGLTSTNLKESFMTSRQKYLHLKECTAAMKKRKAEAYAKYKSEWVKTRTRKVVEFVKDKDALKKMSLDEKIDYALALKAYSEDESEKAHIAASQTQELLNSALEDWKHELSPKDPLPIEEFVAGQYFQYIAKLREAEWIEKQIADANTEYNKTATPEKEDIARYKEVAQVTQAARREKEATIRNEGIEEDTAEMVGDFFMQEELTVEINKTPEERARDKERRYLEENVAKFNRH